MDSHMSNKGRPTTLIGSSPPQLKDTTTSSTSPEKRRDDFKPSLSDSAYKKRKKITKKARIEQPVRDSPRVAYHEFMVLDQAGSAVIACDDTREYKLVAIKRFKRVDQSSTREIPPFRSDSVVNIKQTYLENDDIVIIYEQMDISLRNVTSILQGPFKPFQIAAICKELIAGLSYIHEELVLYHGKLSCGTILLNLDGIVKIANIRESFLQNKCIVAGKRREDVYSICFVMIELMGPSTYILNPRSTELKSLEKWDDEIKSFLSATQHQSLKELEEHDFVLEEPLVRCLRPHIFCALRALGVHWDIISLS